jgi:glyoxylate/hydroxypyruvate reductase A
MGEVVLFKSEADRAEWWRQEIAKRDPTLEFRVWPEAGDVAEIDYVLAWNFPPGELRRYPNLKLIISLGAGVDHLFRDPDLPAEVPICRIIDRKLTMRMTEYVVLHVLRHHRRQRDYEAQQRDGVWKWLAEPAAVDRKVGVMGLGVLGTDAARVLLALGFDLAGWSRTPKHLSGVESYHGADGFVPFLNRTEILVCLLPLTAETEGIIDRETLAALPRGASVVNAARGGHLVEEDLLAALDSGQVSEATLDVFRREPLPPEHRFWDHPRVMLTPHIASITDPTSSADFVVEQVRRWRAGEPPLNLVDPKVGY